MRVPAAKWIVLALLLTSAAAVGAAVLASGNGSASSTPGKLVPVGQGDVSVTVNAIGHVTTLAGAARLTVPGGGPGGSSPSTAGGGSSAGGSTVAGSSGSSASGSGGAREVPLDAVVPAVAGHVTRLLVAPGDQVSAGQPVAVLSDDGTIAAATLQARADLSTARLELAQRRVHDPGRGLPPTAAELASARQGSIAARAKLRALAHPSTADLNNARGELAKAEAELSVSTASAPAAVEAATAAVETAQAKLATVSGAPDAAEFAGGKLELAKAQLEQQTLLTATEPASDVARATAQLAVDAAGAKLEALLRPPPAVVDAARQELAKARADLTAQRAAVAPLVTAAGRAAIRAARSKLRQLAGGPTRDVVAASKADLRKSQADLAMLEQRGAPASGFDLALAGLKVDVAAQRLALERQLADRLTVRANSTGTVTSVLTTVGASADPTTPMMRVQDLEHLVVSTDLSEYDVGRIRLGAIASVAVEALGGRQFEGKVSDVSLAGVESGGVVNFPATIALGRDSGPRPGMSVRARIFVRRARNVLRVPVGAIHEGEPPTVMVRTPAGTTAEREVELGLTGSTYAEVRSGLKPGERVLVPAGGEGE